MVISEAGPFLTEGQALSVRLWVSNVYYVPPISPCHLHISEYPSLLFPPGGQTHLFCLLSWAELSRIPLFIFSLRSGMNTLSRASNILPHPGFTSKTFLVFIPASLRDMTCSCSVPESDGHLWCIPCVDCVTRSFCICLRLPLWQGKKKIKVKFSSTFSGKYLVTGVFLKTSQSALEATPCLADLGLAFCQSDRKLHALSWLSWRLQRTAQHAPASSCSKRRELCQEALSSWRQPVDAQESGNKRPCWKHANFSSYIISCPLWLACSWLPFQSKCDNGFPRISRGVQPES